MLIITLLPYTALRHCYECQPHATYCYFAIDAIAAAYAAAAFTMLLAFDTPLDAAIDFRFSLFSAAATIFFRHTLLPC